MFYRPFNANILRLLMIVGALAALSVLSLSVYNLAFAQQQEVLRFDYDENGMEPVAVFTADDPEGDEVSWRLTGDDAGDFSIENGVLTFKSPPDFEAATGGGDANTLNTYSVNVIATDGNIEDDDTKAVSVTVMDVDEPGMISLLTLQPQAGVTFTTSAIMDGDGAVTEGSEEWQWSSSSSMNGPYTDIDGTKMMMYRPKTADTGRYLKATVTYTDTEGPDKMAMAVSANPVNAAGVLADNSAPEFPDQDPAMDGDQITTATRSIPENTAPGVSVGAPVAADDDDNDVLTYSLSGAGSDLFDIDPATGQITVSTGTVFNFIQDAAITDGNNAASYEVTVAARDPFYDHDAEVNTTDQSEATIVVTVTITDVDEAPEFAATAGGDTSLTFAENTNEPVADGGETTYNATNPEGGAAVTFSLSGDDASKLQIMGGTLTFMSDPDYENPGDADRNNRYEVTVEASDATGMLGTRDVTVMVTNVMEAGMVTLSTLQPQIGVALMTEVTDLDGDVTGPKYQWHMDQGNVGEPCGPLTPTDANEIEGATQASYTPKDDDDVMCLAVVVNYTDGQGSDTATATAMNPVVPDSTPRAPVFGDEDLETDGVQNALAERSVAENTVGGTDDAADDVDAPVMATDPNGDIVTHTLSGADAGSFTIDRGTGQIKVAAGVKLDRETKDTYTVVVTATDPSNMISSIVVTIKIDNVLEGPKVVGDARFDYDENGMEPVAVFTADDPEGDEVSWRLTGDDAGDFSIENGVLTFKSPPDFEAATGGGDANTLNTYSVNVIATDGNIEDDDTKAVSVTVMDVDEPGMISLLTLQPQAGVTFTTSAIMDGDGAVTEGSEEWQWSSSSSMNGPYTDIDGTKMMMYRPKTADTGRYLKATVTYTDTEGPDKMAMAVSANPVNAAGVLADNSAPEFPDQDPAMDGDQITTATRSIPENTAPGVSVGAPVAADDDDNDVLTYSLSGAGSDLFDIDPATGQITVSTGTVFNFIQDAAITDGNNAASYEVTVAARDPFYDHDAEVNTTDQSEATIVVTVTITDVDEAPEFAATAGGDTSLTFAEGTNTPLTGDNTYNAGDPENAAVTYSLSGDDSGELEIADDEMLTFTSMPDYENPGDADRNNRYEVTVEASDATGMLGTRDVTVMVTNVMEAGMVILSTLQPQIGVALMTEVTDLDGDVTGPKYQWHMDQGNVGEPCGPLTPTDANEIEGATQASYTPKDDDDVMCLAVVVNYTDGQGSDTATATAMNPVVPDSTPRAPVFGDEDLETDGVQNSMAERSVAENTVSNSENPGVDAAADADNVGDAVEAMDPNMEVVTHTLSGADAGSFTIDRGTGQIKVAAGVKLDRETKDTYMVEVIATDPRNMSSSIMVTIKLTNVPEGPKIMVGGLGIGGRSSVTYEENGTDYVGMYTASGPNSDMATWSLSGDDASAFSISNDGMLTFRSSPDYENPMDADMDNVYMVTIMADDGTYMDTHDVMVMVTNEDEMGRVTFWRDGQDATTAAIMVGDELGGTVDDSDGNPGDTFPIAMYTRIAGVNVTYWQWAKSMTPDMMDSWTNIGTGGTYTVMDDDAGHYLRATATYNDGEGTGKMKDATTMMVGAVGEMMGEVTLWAGAVPLTMAPQVGETITGLVVDPDGGVTGQMWQWSRTMDTADMSSWMDITDATNDAYMVMAGDTGYYLRVMATYTDAAGTDRAMVDSMPTMMVVPVGGGDHPLVTKFDYNENGQIDKSDVVDAINAYLDEVEGISKTDVIDLINYYLDS